MAARTWRRPPAPASPRRGGPAQGVHRGGIPHRRSRYPRLGRLASPPEAAPARPDVGAAAPALRCRGAPRRSPSVRARWSRRRLLRGGEPRGARDAAVVEARFDGERTRHLRTRRFWTAGQIRGYFGFLAISPRGARVDLRRRWRRRARRGCLRRVAEAGARATSVTTGGPMPIPDPVKVSVSEAREKWADVLAAVERGEGQRVVVERGGKPVAIIVHPEEIEIFERIEDRLLSLEVQRMRAAGKFDDGQWFTTEQVIAACAKADARRRARRRERARTKRRR